MTNNTLYQYYKKLVIASVDNGYKIPESRFFIDEVKLVIQELLEKKYIVKVENSYFKTDITNNVKGSIERSDKIADINESIHQITLESCNSISKFIKETDFESKISSQSENKEEVKERVISFLESIRDYVLHLYLNTYELEATIKYIKDYVGCLDDMNDIELKKEEYIGGIKPLLTIIRKEKKETLSESALENIDYLIS